MEYVNAKELFDGIPEKTTETVDRFTRWVHFSDTNIGRPSEIEESIEYHQLIGMLTDQGRFNHVLIIQDPSNLKEYLFYQHAKDIELALMIFDGYTMEFDKQGDIEKAVFFDNSVALAFENKNDAMQAKRTFQDEVAYHEIS